MINWRENNIELLAVSLIIILVIAIITVLCLNVKSYETVKINGVTHYCDDNASFYYVETESFSIVPVNNGQITVFLPATTTSKTKVYDNPSVCKSEVQK